MNIVMFVITIAVVAAGIFWYSNKDDFSQPKAEYCKHIQELQTQGEYDFSYGNRVKAVLRGCL
jgi:hypothetical protein